MNLNFLKPVRLVMLGALLFTGIAPAAQADTPQTRDDGVTVIHLDEYNGYFAAQETLAGLKPGVYEFVVANKSNKLVGFQIQGMESKKTLDMFPLEPGESRTSRVTVGEDGVRYRCPINPTPWYEVDVTKG
jgi:hypothetical protein